MTKLRARLAPTPHHVSPVNPTAAGSAVLALVSPYVDDADQDELELRFRLNSGSFLEAFAYYNIGVLPSEVTRMLLNASKVEKAHETGFEKRKEEAIHRAVKEEQARGYHVRFAELEASLGSRFLAGRAIPFEQWTDVGGFMEQHSRGSFAESIAQMPHVPLLLFHDRQSFPIGVAEEWHDNDEGLDCVWRLDSADLAQEAGRLAREGIIRGLSIGFQPIFTKRETDEDGLMWLTRTKSRLLEVSLVSAPAFAGAGVTGVRQTEGVS